MSCSFIVNSIYPRLHLSIYLFIYAVVLLIFGCGYLGICKTILFQIFMIKPGEGEITD